MKLLLDSHVFLWSVLEPERLGNRARRLLADVNHELWVSPLTVWELLVAHDKGRIDLGDQPVHYLRRLLTLGPAKEAALTFEVSLMAERIVIPHRDPIDRLLAATAAHYGLTLLTADRALLQGKGFQTLRADR
ncbi:MAG: type II toxin-antitoxin system VapC family toxin [Acidobacteriales bacterium]|nr:type II toxin-antitoxin system VapC family toxin [Terriglobales bacterium]